MKCRPGLEIKPVLPILSKGGDMPKLKPGDKAPDFTLPNIKGEKESLSLQKGNWIILVFYGGNWFDYGINKIMSFAIDYLNL